MNNNDLQLSIPSASSPIYNFANPRHQVFSFRWPFMKYILKNSTAKSWKKLILTCKYFFPKYPVLPVKWLINTKNWWHADGEKFHRTQVIPKIWIYETFHCWNQYLVKNTVSEIIPKIVKCDLHSLLISNQSLTWENYKMLTSSGLITEMSFSNCSFKYSNGKDVTINKLLEEFKHLESFAFTCKFGSNIFAEDAVKKMVKIIPGFKKMRHLRLLELNETFDLSSFMNFLMKNETISVTLKYDNIQFSDAYEQMLENCFEQLVANPPKKFPQILIYGFHGLQYQEYKNICFGKI